MKMLCKACNKVLTTLEDSDCFEIALDILKQHYIFNKSALQQRDLELQQVKERNEQLDKALKILQNNSQQQQPAPPSKRFKSSQQQQQQQSDDSWLGENNSDRVISDVSLTDDDANGVSNLNVAINSEQLFDTSASSPTRSDSNITSSSEFISSPRIKESPKRNKQRDDMRRLRDYHNNKKLERSKSEWQTKERNNAAEKSWATKFLKPSNNANKTLEKNFDLKKTDKKLNLSLKKSKMKQSLIHFKKPSKDESSKRESDTGGEDIIEASPMVSTKNLKYARSWSHRSGQNYSAKDLTCNNSNNNVTNVALANVTMTKDDIDKTLDDIVFDFSPTKKTTDTNQKPNLTNDEMKTKELKFDDDISVDCTALPNVHHLGITNNKSDSSSVMILTPNTQDIIFVDDSCNEEGDIDTMDLMADIMKKGSADDLENLKKYESKSLQKQNKDLETYKKPEAVIDIKQEKVTQNLQDQEMKATSKNKPSVSSTPSNKNLNPLLSTEALDEEEDDDDAMPKPFIIKQDPDSVGCKKKLSIKERFNIDCVECDKLISFLNGPLSDEQIKQYLDKCKHHNAYNNIMRQNTPPDFWNPFILSFQADDPRNEVLIDSRFKNKKN